MISTECEWITKRLNGLSKLSILDIGGGTHYSRLRAQSWIGYELYKPLLSQGNRIDVFEKKLVYRKKDIVFSVPLEFLSRCIHFSTRLRRAFSSFLPLARTVFGDCQKISLRDESYDVVFLLSVLEHVLNPEQTLAEAARVLKSDGQAFVSIPEICPYHAAPIDTGLRMPPDELARFASASFTILDKASVCDQVGTRVSILHVRKNKVVNGSL